MATQLKPLGDHVLVEPVEEENSKKSGIIILDTAKEKPTEAIVRALGAGKTNDEGRSLAEPRSQSHKGLNYGCKTTLI